MKKTYLFNSPFMGGKAKVTIDDGILRIERPGLISKLSHGFTGEKAIRIKDIVSVQLKEAGMTRGYLQFVMAGAIEKKVSITKNNHDENTIYFDASGKQSQINENAKEIKKYIEEYNPEKNENINQDDKYDKLYKLKKLLDEKVISKEEFEKEKEKILN